MLNKTDENGHPYLVPDLKGITFGFSIDYEIMLAVALLYMVFIMFFPQYPVCSLNFVINEY